eukprot:7859951-Lingulodinium_polyedra.AAC.1
MVAKKGARANRRQCDCGPYCAATALKHWQALRPVPCQIPGPCRLHEKNRLLRRGTRGGCGGRGLANCARVLPTGLRHRLASLGRPR